MIDELGSAARQGREGQGDRPGRRGPPGCG